MPHGISGGAAVAAGGDRSSVECGGADTAHAEAGAGGGVPVAKDAVDQSTMPSSEPATTERPPASTTQ